jgi:hypothetical protein
MIQIRARNPESFWPWIRDPGNKHPGSATLHIIGQFTLCLACFLVVELRVCRIL